MFKRFLAKLKFNFNNFQDLAESKVLRDGNSAYLKPSEKWSLGIGWSFLGVLTFGTFWLFLAETDEIVVARGVLAPINNVVEIKVPTGGVIKDIKIEGGQAVKKGDPLFSLDDRSFRESLSSVRSQIDDLEDIRQSRLTQLALVSQQYSLKKKNLTGKIDMQKDILERISRLADEGAMSDLQLLKQQEIFDESLNRYDLLETEEKEEILSLKQELSDIEYQLSSKRSELMDKQIQLEYRVIYSPIDGTVFDVEPKAEGFVASGNMPLMKIVGDGSLQANIRVPAADIGFVSVGMDTEVSVDTFPSNDFGVIEGEIESVGTDSIPMDEIRSIGHYVPATISLDSQQLNSRSRSFDLRSGMTITANIKLRTVKYIELLIGTFKDKSKSLRRVGGRGS